MHEYDHRRTGAIFSGGGGGLKFLARIFCSVASVAKLAHFFFFFWGGGGGIGYGIFSRPKQKPLYYYSSYWLVYMWSYITVNEYYWLLTIKKKKKKKKMSGRGMGLQPPAPPPPPARLGTHMNTTLETW